MADAKPPLILSLDVGSSSARAALFDGNGQRIPGSLIDARYDVDAIASDHGSIKPDRLAESVESLIDQVLAKLPNGVTIDAVATSTFWHSIMGIDAQGTPVTPLLMWFDIRSADHCATLESRLDPPAYHRRTGAPIHSSFPPAKLLWLRNEEPDVYRRAARWVSFGEYLFHRFLGSATASISMASATGLFDQERLNWDQPTLEVLDLEPEKLSTISDETASGLSRRYAERWPALRQARWFPALGDGACANVGSGAIGTQLVALSVGTSGAMRVLWEGKPVAPPPGLWLYRLDAKRPLLGGALSEGGNLWEWISERFHMSPRDTLGERVAAIAPDSHGLTWLPFLAGERSIGWTPDAKGVLTGLTLKTTSAEILRAALEAIAYRFALIAQRLEPFVTTDRRIIGSGNALVNDRNWPQIISDAVGWELVESEEPEASLRGAALAALERLGAIERLERASGSVLDEGPRFQPDPQRHEIYRKGLARQEELYRRLMG